MKRIRFLREEQYEHGGRRSGPVFAAGDVRDVRDEVARYWLKRPGAAEEVGADVAITAVTPTPPPAKRRRRRRVS